MQDFSPSPHIFSTGLSRCIVIENRLFVLCMCYFCFQYLEQPKLNNAIYQLLLLLLLLLLNKPGRFFFSYPSKYNSKCIFSSLDSIHINCLSWKMKLMRTLQINAFRTWFVGVPRFWRASFKHR